MKQLYKNYNEKIEQNRKDTKRINIFLTKDQYSKIYQIKNTYRLGLSIITQIVFEKYIFNKEIREAIKELQLYKTTYKKSSIKIKYGLQDDISINNAKCVNNAIVIFLNKMETMYTTNKEAEKLRNDIYNLFQNTQDPFYNYNENVRQFVYMQRFIK